MSLRKELQQAFEADLQQFFTDALSKGRGDISAAHLEELVMKKFGPLREVLESTDKTIDEIIDDCPLELKLKFLRLRLETVETKLKNTRRFVQAGMWEMAHSNMSKGLTYIDLALDEAINELVRGKTNTLGGPKRKATKRTRG